MEEFLRLFAITSCSDEIILMENEITASGVVDLYEEMLHRRGAKGIRPVLYISSYKDLECSVQMLLDETPEKQLPGQPRLAARVFRRRAMMH